MSQDESRSIQNGKWSTQEFPVIDDHLGRLREDLEGAYMTFQGVSRAAQRALSSLREALGTIQRTPQ